MQEAPSFLSPLFISPEFRADFIERIPKVATSTDKETTLSYLQLPHQQAARNLGFAKTYHAEQIHACAISHIHSNSAPHATGADALITAETGLLLGIHVADCGVLYLVDRKTKALGILHSGKKGTEQNITAKTIAAMNLHFGSNPDDLIAVLGPCIRPPHYEVDFAKTIGIQALDSGIRAENYHDCGLCTASNLSKFYSYRLEKGNTGRHLALLGRLPL